MQGEEPEPQPLRLPMRRNIRRTGLIVLAGLVVAVTWGLAGMMYLGAVVTSASGTLGRGWLDISLGAWGLVVVGAAIAILLVRRARRHHERW